MEIRKLVQQDIDILESTWDVRKPFEDRLHSMQKGESIFFICWEEKIPIGHGKIIASNPPIIEDMYIDEKRRSQGLGAKLLAFLEERTGYPVRLEVESENVRAISFYQKNKYAVIEKGGLLLLEKKSS